MKVTVEHNAYTDTLGSRRGYRVILGVIFSEEEKAIIRLRNLAERFFTVRAADPLPTKTVYLGTTVLRHISTVMILVGLVLGIASAFTRSGEALADLLFFGGIGLKIYAHIQRRKQKKLIENRDQKVTLDDLLTKRTISIFAFDPAEAKVIEDQLRSFLTSIKSVIEDSAEITERQTFEI